MILCRLCDVVNPLNAELNPIFPLLALLGAHPILHVSRITVKTVSFKRKITTYGLDEHLNLTDKSLYIIASGCAA